MCCLVAPGQPGTAAGNVFRVALGHTARRRVVAVVASVLLLWAGGPQAQVQPRPTYTPSTLLPMEPIWTTALPASPAAAPVHEAGRVFVALRDDQIVAVNLADGEVAWQIVQLVIGQPAVGGDLLYVASRDELLGIETATGLVRWSIPLEASLSAPLVWNAGWLIAALDTQTLLALRADTGETIWRQAMDGGIHVTPSLAGDRMYVSLDSGGVVALALMTGDAVWEQRLEGSPSEILPLDDLFVGSTDNHLYRLSRLDGSIKWRWRTGGDIVGLPAVDEKRVYFSSLDNMLWALNRTNGVQQWSRQLSARPTAGPSHAGDLLVLGGMSQQLSFFDRDDGVSYGGITAPSELAFPPVSLSTAVDGPLLVTVTGDGQLRALRRATGPVRLDPALTALLGQAAENTDDATSATATPTPTTPTPVTGVTDVTDVAAGRRPSVGGEYAIQVAVFANDASASGLVDRLIEQGYPAYVIEPRLDDGGALYRVRIGDYPDRSAAETIGRQIADEEQLDWYVVALP